MLLVEQLELRFQAFDVAFFALAEGALGGAVLGPSSLTDGSALGS